MPEKEAGWPENFFCDITSWEYLTWKIMQLNDKAPEFTLANEDGQEVSLKDLRGKNVVLFFYPKANTSG
jgi:peroxiredoxin